MGAFGITNDICSVTKTSKSTLVITPHNQYCNTELDDNRLSKLWCYYVSLLTSQYKEDCEKGVQSQ